MEQSVPLVSRVSGLLMALSGRMAAERAIHSPL